MSEYLPDNHYDAEARAGYWDAGIGLQKVDGLVPTEKLYELADKNIKDELSYAEVERLIIEDYATQDLGNVAIRNNLEADLVSARIARLLDQNDFTLAVSTLRDIHVQLFKGLELLGRNYAPGQFKTQQWVKAEYVLYDKSVAYGSPESVQTVLSELIAQEKIYQYALPFEQEGLVHIASFATDIWEVHAFNEGNTRTVAVFVEKYLNKLGFKVSNDEFLHHATYFRDALVRSAYSNLPLGISKEPRFLRLFFENLIVGTNHNLDAEYLREDRLKSFRHSHPVSDSHIH